MDYGIIHKIEDVCTIDAFKRNPNYVNKFYNERRALLTNPTVQPNKAHKNLAVLEKLLGGRICISHTKYR